MNPDLDKLPVEINMLDQILGNYTTVHNIIGRTQSCTDEPVIQSSTKLYDIDPTKYRLEITRDTFKKELLGDIKVILFALENGLENANPDKRAAVIIKLLNWIRTDSRNTALFMKQVRAFNQAIEDIPLA